MTQGIRWFIYNFYTEFAIIKNRIRACNRERSLFVLSQYHSIFLDFSTLFDHGTHFPRLLSDKCFINIKLWGGRKCLEPGSSKLKERLWVGRLPKPDMHSFPIEDSNPGPSLTRWAETVILVRDEAIWMTLNSLHSESRKYKYSFINKIAAWGWL